MTEEEPIVEVWLSGNEVIHLVSDLVDPNPVDKDPRASGRTTKLALKYASLALAHPAEIFPSSKGTKEISPEPSKQANASTSSKRHRNVTVIPFCGVFNFHKLGEIHD